MGVKRVTADTDQSAESRTTSTGDATAGSGPIYSSRPPTMGPSDVPATSGGVFPFSFGAQPSGLMNERRRLAAQPAG